KTNSEFKEILEDEKFSALNESIKALVSEFVGDENKRRMIHKKTKELNRPALIDVLGAMLKKYNINWVDLYPPEKDLRSLINTRNTLFHSSQEINSDGLVNEMYRVQALVERIILSLLGWRDFSKSPESFIKSFITRAN
ncbi:MAG TPA: hypothetical protein VGB10_03970, partial [Bacteroidota bacterium]